MCEANAFLVQADGSEELVMERVDTVTPENDGLVLRSIFGEQKFLSVRIRELALVDHRIVLEPL